SSKPSYITSENGWNKPQSAEVCGNCHRWTLAAWNHSRHARSYDSDSFRESLQRAKVDLGTEAQQSCLHCHAPLAQLDNDPDFQLKVTWEGVTCDYCHSIRAISQTSDNAEATCKFNSAKSSPTWATPDPHHGAVPVDVFNKSEFCALCHQYQNKLGYQPITTFAEWKASRYAKEGRQCQYCHMSLTKYGPMEQRLNPRVMDAEWHDHNCGTCHAVHVVDGVKSRDLPPGIMTKPEFKQLKWHGLDGEEGIEHLANALSAELTTAREGGKLRVIVAVTNTAAGHSLPTGSPMRRLVLEVHADTDSGKHFSAERIYRKLVGDAEGKPLDKEYMVIVRGAKTLEDTRLVPDERRTETFEFDIPPGSATQVKAVFSFSTLSSTTDSKVQLEKRVAFLTLDKQVP
ncbi:MAG: cytochrome c family protein, partial [Acidobacteriaceae bacterium]|nr:cytochrome c family protein [Acidobacteriaceae bacterium]